MNKIQPFSGKSHIGEGKKPLCGKKLLYPYKKESVRLDQYQQIQENWDNTWVVLPDWEYCSTCLKIFKANQQ